VPNNPTLFYKPGLTMDTPVTVTLAAADWAIFMSWTFGVDTSGASHIIHGAIAKQVSDQIYDQPSLKAAFAEYAESQQSPFRQFLGDPRGGLSLQSQLPFPDDNDDNDNENEEE
jgi:hypothetical protein